MQSNIRERLRLPSSCKCSQPKVALTIADNGKGFRLGSGPTGMGLENMKYRAGVISGSLNVITAPHRGTLVKCIRLELRP